MTNNLTLAERVEAATGPDYALDQEILRALGWAYEEYDEIGEEPGYVWRDPNGKIPQQFPSPTASLDAAMTLVNGTLYGVELASNAQDEWRCELSTHLADGICEKAATKELALVAAALRSHGSGGEG